MLSAPENLLSGPPRVVQQSPDCVKASHLKVVCTAESEIHAGAVERASTAGQACMSPSCHHLIRPRRLILSALNGRVICSLATKSAAIRWCGRPMKAAWKPTPVRQLNRAFADASCCKTSLSRRLKMKFELRIEAHSGMDGKPVFSAGVIGVSGVIDSAPAPAPATH